MGRHPEEPRVEVLGKAAQTGGLSLSGSQVQVELAQDAPGGEGQEIEMSLR